MLFVLGIFLGILAVIFTIQNITVITVVFFGWQLTGSLALILMLAILSGILITLLLVLPQSIGNYFKYRRYEKEIQKLEEDLRHQKELTVFAAKVPPTKEDIARIEHGAIHNSAV